jgi:hypothetical protein
LAEAGLLSPPTCYFDDLLSLADLPAADRIGRMARRQDWLDRALAATSGCDLIFADPDNGIRPTAHRIRPHSTKAVKHAYLGELAAFVRRGQSLVVYHHADRTADVNQQAFRRLDDLAADVPAEPIAAVRASRGTVRLFLVAAATRTHAQHLKARLTSLENSPLRAELPVYWHKPACWNSSLRATSML